jgi:hypothetical protein
MIISPEKPFLLSNYAEAMACASLTAGCTCEPCCRYLGDCRVLDFLDISATDDFSFPPDSSTSSYESVIGSCLSSSRPSSVSG